MIADKATGAVEFVKGGVQRVSVRAALRHPFVRKVARYPFDLISTADTAAGARARCSSPDTHMQPRCRLTANAMQMLHWIVHTLLN